MTKSAWLNSINNTKRKLTLVLVSSEHRKQEKVNRTLHFLQCYEIMCIICSLSQPHLSLIDFLLVTHISHLSRLIYTLIMFFQIDFLQKNCCFLCLFLHIHLILNKMTAEDFWFRGGWWGEGMHARVAFFFLQNFARLLLTRKHIYLILSVYACVA